jgi:hypothetical protein
MAQEKAFSFDETYRTSAEYKDWYALIKVDHPLLPDYLIDLAIISHKVNPLSYKNEYKETKEKAKLPPKKRQPRKEFVVPGAVQVFDSVDDVPVLPA